MGLGWPGHPKGPKDPRIRHFGYSSYLGEYLGEYMIIRPLGVLGWACGRV